MSPVPRIRIVENGPYLVTGGVPLLRMRIVVDEKGESVAWEEIGRLDAGETYALCRCGSSASKPFCDGSHLRAGFDGTETASRDTYLEQAVLIEGPVVSILDAKPLCADARFCAASGGVWHLVERAVDESECECVRRQCALCPSGRYTAVENETGERLEPELEPSIALVEDPHLGVSGPLWVRGGIMIEAADGTEYEVRNRVTLCRCGGSSNKPFCDGSHIDIGFADDLGL